MKKLILLSILLCQPLFACESYEECIHGKLKWSAKGVAMGFPADEREPVSDQDVMKAIAFKLDEISSLLKNKDSQK